MHLVFLELDTHRHHLDFKILDENNNKVIPRTFYLQLLNKDQEYIRQWNQNLSRFKPFSTTRTSGILVKKINWNWSLFSRWNWGPQTGDEKKEKIKHNHRYSRRRLNYLSSDRRRGLYPSICQRCWPARWRCLRRAWGSSFPFNGRHTKIFQGSNGEARKIWCHYATCPKQVRQYSRYHFTGNVGRRHLAHWISQSIARKGKIS